MKVSISEFVYTSEQESGLCVMSESVNSPGLPFCLFTRNHHSMSLGGKYTFWEDLMSIGRTLVPRDYTCLNYACISSLEVRDSGCCRLRDRVDCMTRSEDVIVADLCSDLVTKITCQVG